MLGWLGFPYHPFCKQLYISLEGTLYKLIITICLQFCNYLMGVICTCISLARQFTVPLAIFYSLSPSYASILSFVSRFTLTINSKLSQKLRISVSRTHHVEVFALCPIRSLLDGNLARCNFPFVMAHFTALTSDHS